ncbi:MAG: radical SAM protein [Candidatus Saganbacteria bacterium]|nr:radical SAM protein [Candidatus Saganbacteria bacterium]
MNMDPGLMSGYWRGMPARAVEAAQLIYGGQSSSLRRMVVNVTTACNLKCRYCDVTKKHKPEVIPKEKLLDIIWQAVEMGVEMVHFTGGESTTIPWLEEAIALVVALGKEATIVTNGVTDPKRAESLVSAGVSKINLSFDVVDREGGSRAKRVALTFAEALSKLRRTHDFAFYINCVIDKGNFRLLPEHLKFLLYHLDFNGIHPIPIRNHPGVCMEIDDVREYFEVVLPAAREIIRGRFPGEDPETTEFYRLLPQPFGCNPEEWPLIARGDFPDVLRYPCYLSLSEIAIGADAKAYNCPLTYYDGGEAIGDTNTQALAEIYRAGKTLERIQSRIPLESSCSTGCSIAFGKYNRSVYEMLQLQPSGSIH